MLSRGQRLGRYEVLGPLGAGGMGEVYRARDDELEREVAVKVLPERVAGDPLRLERFQREARAVARLSHPNILEIHDFGSDDGISYAVTELLEGETLREQMLAGPMPWSRAREIATAVADGLAAAHDKGVIHRDLKPENIFIISDGRVKVLDFGLARVQEELATEAETGTLTPAGTQQGTVLGTVGYMAPEQVKGQVADARSDIFALGCVLYEMLSGQRAFLRDSPIETMAAILKDDPPPFAASGVSLSPELANTIQRCLEKRPERRFQSAADLAFALRALTSDSDASRSVPMTGPTSGGRWRTPLLVVIAVVTVAGLAFVGWRALRHAPEPVTAEAGPAETTTQAAPWIESWRVAVAPFENRTGDAVLDPLGRTLADRLMDGLRGLTRGLPSLPPVTPVSTGDGGAMPVPLGDAPFPTEGRLLVTGAYSPSPAGLQVVARISDPSDRRVLYATDPMPLPTRPSRDELDPLLERVMGAVGTHVRVGLENVSYVPEYGVFREYVRGVEEAWSGNPEGKDRIKQALERDPEFLAPAFWLGEEGPDEDARHYLDHIRLRSSRLTRYESLYLAALEAWGSKDFSRALEAAREMVEINPYEYMPRKLRAGFAAVLGRPQEAAEALEPALEHFPGVYSGERFLRRLDLFWSYQYLGRWEDMLGLGRRLRRDTPGDTTAVLIEVAALAWLERLEEMERVIRECELEPGGHCDVGMALNAAACNLTAAGRKAEGLAYGRRAVAAFRSKMGHGALNKDDQQIYLVALYAAEMWQDYADFARQLMSRVDPESGLYLRAVSGVGVASAHLGDRAAAERAMAELEARQDYLFAGRVAAALGELDRAVDDLKRSMTHGWGYSALSPVMPYYEPLRGYPPYEELFKTQR